MALSPQKALEAARNVYDARIEEMQRLDFIYGALHPKRYAGDYINSAENFRGTSDEFGYPTVELPKTASPTQQRLAWKARTNFLPLVLKTYSQTMKVDGFPTTKSDLEGGPWRYLWQPNGFDARQAGVHRSALGYGASYVTITKGDTGPVMRGVSPRTMTAVYQDPTEDEWPMLALRVDNRLMRLYDEEMVYFIGSEDPDPRTTFGTPASLRFGGAEWHYIEARPHDMGVCPVVRFRDRMLLEGEEQFGIIEPLIDIQKRIDETIFGLMVAQYFAAFKQRYVIGWAPEDETEGMRATAKDFWTFKDSDVEVGQFQETDLTRYLKSKDSALGDMAAIAQVPAQSLGVEGISNISAETLAALEAGKEREADEISTSFGESWEQAFRLGAHAAGDAAAAADMSSEVKWKNTTARSLAQVTDATVKWVTSLGVNEKLARQWIPGWTDQLEAENARLGPSVLATSDPLSALMANMQRQGGTGGTGGVAAGA
jgi:hypothetical protein